jgi:pilus assembly protein CpaE
MKRNTVAIVSPDREVVSSLTPLLQQEIPTASIVEIASYPERRLYEEMALQPPLLILLDVGPNPEAAFENIQVSAKFLPGVPVVAVLPKDDPDLILRCLRQGAAEFLLRPVTAEQFHAAIARALPHRSGAGTGGARVTLLMPVKGACGASTIASNLPFLWKRNGYGRVLLGDLDPTTGTISFLLKMKSTYSFMDALTREEGLDSELWKALVTKRNGVDVLLAPEQPIDVSNSERELEALVNFVRQTYDLALLDSGNPYSLWTLTLADLSDQVLLVTTNELTSLRAAQRVLANLERYQISRDKVLLVVNRYNTEIGLNQEAIETALHCDVYHVMPSDFEAVQAALVQGESIVHSTGFGKSLAQLADRLAEPKGSGDEKKKKKSSTVGALITSLFSRASS